MPLTEEEERIRASHSKGAFLRPALQDILFLKKLSDEGHNVTMNPEDYNELELID